MERKSYKISSEGVKVLWVATTVDIIANFDENADLMADNVSIHTHIHTLFRRSFKFLLQIVIKQHIQIPKHTRTTIHIHLNTSMCVCAT